MSKLSKDETITMTSLASTRAEAMNADTTPTPGPTSASDAHAEIFQAGLGKRRINVRIFKEPPAEQPGLEPEKEAQK
jgi:hypothetical protein